MSKSNTNNQTTPSKVKGGLAVRKPPVVKQPAKPKEDKKK